MKRISLYLFSLLMLAGFSACNEDFDDWADPQSNPQEESKTLAFEVSGESTDLDLNTLTVDTVNVAKVVSVSKGERDSVAYEIFLAKEGAGTEKVGLSYSLKNNFIQVAVSDLEDGVWTLYGKLGTERALKLWVNAFIITPEGQASRVNSTNALDMKVVTRTLPVEEAYYLIGDINGWKEDTMLEFVSKGEGIFELDLSNPKEGSNFKIIPKSGIDNGDIWGAALGAEVDGDPATSGWLTFKKDGKEPGAIQMEKAGDWRITLNMNEYSYKIGPQASQYLWVAGDHQNWDPSTAPQLYSIDNNLKYNGFVYLKQFFKFVGQPEGWEPVNYGIGETEGALKDHGDNLSVSEEGFYFLQANIDALTYTTVKINEMSIIGSVKGNWDEDVDLVYDKVANCWSTTADLNAGEFKFRFNHDWEIGVDVGGSMEHLIYKGGNILLPEAGNYTVKVYLTNDESSYCTFTKNE